MNAKQKPKNNDEYPNRAHDHEWQIQNPTFQRINWINEAIALSKQKTSLRRSETKAHKTIISMDVNDQIWNIGILLLLPISMVVWTYGVVLTITNLYLVTFVHGFTINST